MMNSETLQTLVTKGDLTPLAEALAPLSEMERRKLSTTAHKLYREYKAGFDAWGFGAFSNRSCSPRSYAAAVVAMLGACPWSRVKGIPAWGYRDIGPEVLLSVLCGRRPTWMNDWLALRLSHDVMPSWQVVRTLVRTGVCETPPGEDYIKLLVREFNHPTRRLLDDPDLLDDEIWRLFEIETDAFITYNGNHLSYFSSTYESWPTALKTLADGGRIDRQRLLDASLQALTNGFSPYYLSGFCKFHLNLEPTAEEMTACEASYRQLLCHPVGHVVTFALRMLKALDKAAGLDGESFLKQILPVFAIPTKRQATQALQLAKRLVKRHPELSEQAIEVGLQALGHVSADVHDLAFTLLEQHINREHLVERLASLSPENQPGVKGLLVRLGIEAVSEPAAASVYHERVPPSPADILNVNVLTGLKPLAPIETLDDLIDAVSHAIEVVDSPEEVERILDGLSRLCDQRPANFEARTEALLYRILQSPFSSRGLLSAMSPVSQGLRGLLLSWLTTDALPKDLRAGPSWELGPAAFIESRLVELTKRVARRQAGLLLSAPTHEHGWIDPVSLVERVCQIPNDLIQSRRLDLIQALLRLSPDRRSEALQQAAALHGAWGTVLRWALGGTDEPETSRGIDAALWIAAGRARCPHDSLAAALAPLEIKAQGPDALEPAQYHWQDEPKRVRHYSGYLPCSSLRIEVSPPVERQSRRAAEQGVDADDRAWLTMLGDLLAAGTTTIIDTLERSFGSMSMQPHATTSYHLREMPTTALHDWYMSPSAGWEHAQFIKWVAMVWPLNPDSTHAMAVQSMMSRIDASSSSSHADFAHLDTLFVPHWPWSEMGQFMLGLALISKNADVKGLAVDAFIEGIEDGRAHPWLLADVLSRLAAGQGIKMNRLTPALEEVARVSTQHRAMVAEIIQAFLTEVTTWPRNTHLLLELLLVSLTELGWALREPMRAVLRPLKGTQKSAKLSRRLLALQTSRSPLQSRQRG